MRTTLTLDDDVALKLRAEVRRSGSTLRRTVNDCLRRTLNGTPPPVEPASFAVRARDLGDLRPGLCLDQVADLLEQVEGPLRA